MYYADRDDTGWRNVTALSGVVTGGTIRLRRVGGIVYWRIEEVSSTTDPDAILNLVNQVPVGFRDLNWQRYALALPSGARARTTAGAELRLESGGATGATLEGQFSYPTSDAWPAALPGIAG